MIEIEGEIGRKQNCISAAVFIDSERIGTLKVSLAQWDRLRLHRTLSSAAQNAGVAIIVEAKQEDEPI